MCQTMADNSKAYTVIRAAQSGIITMKNSDNEKCNRLHETLLTNFGISVTEFGLGNVLSYELL